MSKQLFSFEETTALWVSAFFDELVQAGVRDVVVSPGSRSTALAMVAHVSSLNLFVDVDERGAAFFALGLAKASKQPVCLICTSGSATANYYPAIMEAHTSRVPLIVLTADRPPHLQNLGAPQTCDQVKMFGDYVRHFQQMPLPGAALGDIAFVRQMALTAFVKSAGTPSAVDRQGRNLFGCIGSAGPVHFNFPFDEPLKPDLQVEGLFTMGRTGSQNFSTSFVPSRAEKPDAQSMQELMAFMAEGRGIVLCSEGTYSTAEEAKALLAWAQRFNLPLIADPLSNLRQFDHECVVDAYGGIFGSNTAPTFDYVIRFGQYPVSKRCFTSIKNDRPVQIVVDACETRDFNSATDVFVQTTPAAFVRAFEQAELASDTMLDLSVQRACLEEWVQKNRLARERAAQAIDINQGFEGSFVCRLLELAPEDSLVFSANSMAIRMIDTFYAKANKRLTCLCNRGLNGIDGTTSTALGAAQCFDQTTYFTGDLTFLHDINALALQYELLEKQSEASVPSIIIVLFNNQGGGIFDLLPQKSSEPYYERLFTTEQSVNFAQIVRGFGVVHHQADTVEEAARTYKSLLGTPGISVIEVALPLDGLAERYGQFLL